MVEAFVVVLQYRQNYLHTVGLLQIHRNCRLLNEISRLITTLVKEIRASSVAFPTQYNSESTWKLSRERAKKSEEGTRYDR